MDDLISRRAAIEAIASRDETNGTVKVFTGRQVNEILESLPSADRPMGEWLARDCVFGVVYCSECGYELKQNDTHFCPNCGARMKGTDDE